MASFLVIICPYKPDGTRFVSIPETWKNLPFNLLTACQNTAREVSKQGSAKHCKQESRTIRPGRTTPPQLKQNSSSRFVSVGICGFKHVRFATVPLQQLRAVANHPHISPGSNHFPPIPSTTRQHWSHSLMSPPAPEAWSIRPVQAWVANYPIKASETWSVYTLFRDGGNRSDWITKAGP